VGDRPLAEEHHVARVVGHQPGDERLGRRVVDGGHARGEEVDPGAHPVGVAGEDLAQALALGEDRLNSETFSRAIYFRKWSLTVVV
jgi:hypothetical protein